MRLVFSPEPGKVELNWMWLPTFCADARTKMHIEKELGPELVGKELTNEVLDWAHERVIAIICARFAIVGLATYLDAIKFVEGPADG